MGDSNFLSDVGSNADLVSHIEEDFMRRWCLDRIAAEPMADFRFLLIEQALSEGLTDEPTALIKALFKPGVWSSPFATEDEAYGPATAAFIFAEVEEVRFILGAGCEGAPDGSGANHRAVPTEQEHADGLEGEFESTDDLPWLAGWLSL